MTRRKFLASLGLGGFALGASGFWATRPYAKNPYYNGPPSDHFDGRVFFNPDGDPPGKLSDLLRWQLSGNRAPWPEARESPFEKDRPPTTVVGRNLRVTHVGHATFLIQTNGLNLLTDPVWSQRASPVSFAGPKRVNEPGIEMDALPKIDAVLVTHSHYDHMDMPTLATLVARDKPPIITPLGNDTLIRSAIQDADTIAADWDGIVTLANDTRIHFDPCHHWGARGMGDRRMTLWAAFTIETPALKIHHIGDTGFHSGIDFRKAREKHGGFDLAILPIGAYEPRWFMKYQHINPLEAVEGFELLNAKRAIGHHWGTFQLTDEAIDEPKEQLAQVLAEKGIPAERFEAGHPGQVFTI